MSTITLTEITRFFVVHCYKCAVAFAIPNDLDDQLRRSHEAFYCPHGHSQSYLHKSDVEKAREAQQAAEEAQRRAERDAASAREDAEIAEALRQKAEKAAKRLKHRVSAGSCPCCKRSFVALARHMATKHPEFVKAAKP